MDWAVGRKRRNKSCEEEKMKPVLNLKGRKGINYLKTLSRGMKSRNEIQKRALQNGVVAKINMGAKWNGRGREDLD